MDTTSTENSFYTSKLTKKIRFNKIKILVYNYLYITYIILQKKVAII